MNEEEVKKLKCQYPIVRGEGSPDPCTKDAVKYDMYGWTYCEEHSLDCYTPLHLTTFKLKARRK